MLIASALVLVEILLRRVAYATDRAFLRLAVLVPFLISNAVILAPSSCVNTPTLLPSFITFHRLIYYWCGGPISGGGPI